MLADVFKNIRNVFLIIYGFDPVKFLSAPGFAWQVGSKKIKAKLYLLTDIDMY